MDKPVRTIILTDEETLVDGIGTVYHCDRCLGEFQEVVEGYEDSDTHHWYYKDQDYWLCSHCSAIWIARGFDDSQPGGATATPTDSDTEVEDSEHGIEVVWEDRRTESGGVDWIARTAEEILAPYQKKEVK